MNKYEIYVDQKQLLTFIKDNNIQDKNIFNNEWTEEGCDFDCISGIDGYINFFSEKFDSIDGCSLKLIHNFLKNGKEVTPEQFLLTIGYEDELDRTLLQHLKEINTEPFDKYKVYVDCKELTEYHEKYGLNFNDSFGFRYLDSTGVSTFEFDELGGYYKENTAIEKGMTKVDLYTFVTKVLGEEWKAGEPIIPEKLKVEDVHYFDKYTTDDYIHLEQDIDGNIKIVAGSDDTGVEIYLPSESLIQLGQDLIRIGVQQQIKEDKGNE